MNYIKFILSTLIILTSSSLLGTEKNLSSKCTFLCNLEREETTSITLIGEKHYSKSSDLIKDIYHPLACSGDIYLSKEGSVEGKINELELQAICGEDQTNKALIYGLENASSKDLIAGFDSYFYFVHDLKHNNNYETILRRKLNFILSIGEKETTRDIFKKISKNFEHKFPKFIKLLNKYIDNYERENNIPIDFIKEELIANNKFMNNLKAFLELSKAFAHEIGMRTQANLGFSDEEFKCYFDILNDPHNTENQEKLAEFFINYRDIIMAENLAKLYCEAQSSGKDIYAIVGAKHLDGIKTFLENAADGKVKVKTIDLGGNRIN